MKPSLILLLLLAACGVTSSAQSPRTDRAETRLTRALAGLTAGEPRTCIPPYGRNDQEIIDSGTILFRSGRDTVYRNDFVGGCGGLDRTRAILVTPTLGGRFCRGDIVRVIDTATGTNIGSCAFSDFLPYTRERADPRGS